MKNPTILLAALALASCAPPKAIVIAEAPKKQPAAPISPVKPVSADDGMRVPDDILALPDDGELRSSSAKPADEDATIITSPPSE